jgi:hypothetical protein
MGMHISMIGPYLGGGGVRDRLLEAGDPGEGANMSLAPEEGVST